ncbi:ABC transporter family protein [Tritrichomonas foetus]|uniref:ABC transporter family protein n=1 Tax=Tritrichomonas foetus TaxID=1144522 RepID=A0A1J4JN49_9EUKA|nr:ABC transporter family protein [Tritrichomonas foetus]|eukprot:OHS99863.1 ABC transporter family protein [Tritrichomonas foetus]
MKKSSKNLDEISMSETTADRSPRSNFWRTVRALFKKSFLIKVRHPVTIIEFIISCIVWIPIYPSWLLARQDYRGYYQPNISYTNLIPINLLTFYAITENSTFIITPDCNNTRRLVELMNETINLALNLTDAINDSYINDTFGNDTFISYTDYIENFKFEPQFAEDVDELKRMIYEHTSNGIGVNWANADDNETALTKPILETYRQSFVGSPDTDLFEVLYRALAIMNGFPQASLAATNTSWQPFSTPPTVELFDLEILIAIIGVIPIIISTMPDLQSLLEEKDTRVQTLSFLMGCSETAYWLVSFCMQFILSVIPYLLMCLFLCFVFAMNGTDFSLMFVISLLFIIAHIWFLMFLTTFMKKASMGRLIVVVFLVFAVFFAYVHYFFTLDDSNSNEAVKHVFSIIPLSCYQLIMMTMYTQCKTSMPVVTWKDLSNGSLKYQVWYAIMWLPIDAILYFLLFVLFNLMNPRDFGSPPLSWREIFSRESWRRLFGRKAAIYNCDNTSEQELMSVTGLSKTYNGYKTVTALSNVEFQIKQNEVIVVIGPNGAGKSTLINILAGAIEPTSGALRLFGGAPTKRFKEIQQILGVCFQDNVIISRLSIAEHFDLFGAFKDIPHGELEQTRDFFADTLQLREMLKTRAGDLSGGQKRKLCIALSLLGDPPLVIMDEPTAGVDVQSRQLIWKVIASLKHTTTIVTSHALEEAEAVSSRLFVVAGGQMPFAGTATELRSQFKCGYVLRIDTENKQNIENVLQMAQSFEPDAKLSSDRDDTIELPVSRSIPKFINELEDKKESLGISSFSFSVEQLEDVLLKLIQMEEVNYAG